MHIKGDAMTKNSNCRKHGKQIKGDESTDTFQSLAVHGNEQGRQNKNPEAGWKKAEGGKALLMGRQRTVKETPLYNYPFIHCLQTHKQEKAVYKDN